MKRRPSGLGSSLPPRQPHATLATMPYGPSENLLRLARYLAGTRMGVTTQEMAEYLGISRRTAERMRDALASTFPQLEFTEDDNRTRRWRLPATALAGLTAPGVECIAAVEAAAREADLANQTDRADQLRDAAATLRTILNPAVLTRVEPDLAALMEAEGLARRPGPRPEIPRALLATLRRAILGMQVIAVTYNSPNSGPTPRRLCPYGLLYGGRGWLVAHADTLPEMRLWRLDRILSAQILAESFPRDTHFSLETYAARAFGVFQEEPFPVTLRFTPEAAADAATWHFHPSQQMVMQPDGSLIVTFNAGGRHEICWHLFTWGSTVQILAPDHLRQTMIALTRSALTRAEANPQP